MPYTFPSEFSENPLAGVWSGGSWPKSKDETVEPNGAGFLSLPLAKVHVQEGADEEERDADPRQDEAVTKVAFPRIFGII